MKNLVIVGGGQSAAQCVLTLKRNAFKNKITLISEEKHIPYQRPPLSKEYLSDEVTLDRVYMKSKEFYDQNNVEIISSTKVIAIDRNKKSLTLSNTENLQYENLVLATGSRVRKLEVEGSHLSNINYLRTIEEADQLKKYFKLGKKLVVIGAGYIGLEVAAAAIKKGLGVTVIEMADRVMNRTVDPIISKYFDSL
ncbi:MAG TPA: pyridine nucleotide-disulfide oxidoreductase, partial [Gammaproteobacteria bacterium]|nr:pyridine nucleotide-disulfide oxidoreductase [Gammaproteobacteria bacterium]